MTKGKESTNVAEAKAKATRIYKVEGPAADQTRLVRATSPNAALRHCVASDYRASFAEQDECIELASRGVKVETAGADAEAGE